MEPNATTFLASCENNLFVNTATHYSACEKNQKTNWWFGIFLIIISTFNIAFTFVDVKGTFAPWLMSIPFLKTWFFWLPVVFPFVIGGFSILAAILASILTFSNFGEKSAKHQLAGIGYARLLREVKSRQCNCYSEEQNAEYIERFKSDWAEISKNAPLTDLDDRRKHGDDA
ncbi:MAG: SLATT domain-containing protein [Rhizobiaceae bacterium]|nr:SLATT domain-containing protein [Rhizobiaceae bacterium]